MEDKVKNKIALINDYYLVLDDINSNEELIDLKKINIINVLKKRRLLLRIDFKTLNEKSYKRILKKLLRIKFLSKVFKINIGIEEDDKSIKLGCLINYNEKDKDENDFINGINAILFDTTYERYNYIYDTVCNYLDSFFYGKNLCDFKDNKCGEKRNTSSITGCCHHFKVRALGPLTKLVLCEYLNKENYTCDAKCLSCKLFTCDYLESKGIKFRIKDILLLNTFFNPLQKYYIKYMVFTPKEKILKRLIITKII